MNLQTVVTILHVLVGAAIVALVMVQRGKGADAGAAFGSGASGTVFGARGSANFLSRTTAVLATIFFMTSLGLAYLGAQRQPVKSVIDAATPAVPAAQPETPAVPGAVPAPAAPSAGTPAPAATPGSGPGSDDKPATP